MLNLGHVWDTHLVCKCYSVLQCRSLCKPDVSGMVVFLEGSTSFIIFLNVYWGVLCKL